MQGRSLKLLSGLMMFILGLVLLIDPALLNNIFVSVGILAIVGPQGEHGASRSCVSWSCGLSAYA